MGMMLGRLSSPDIAPKVQDAVQFVIELMVRGLEGGT